MKFYSVLLFAFFLRSPVFLFLHYLFLYNIKMRSQYRIQAWHRQFQQISKVLAQSIKATDAYSKYIFQNQEEFLYKYSKQYTANLKRITHFQIDLQPKKLYQQLHKKLHSLTQFFFPQREQKYGEVNQIRIKQKRIQRILRKLQSPEAIANVKIQNENIRTLLQYDSKLNMSYELFIFKIFILSENEDAQQYSAKRAPLTLEQKSLPEKTRLKFDINHGYFEQEGAKIILSNLPTLGSYKSVFNKALESNEIQQLRSYQANDKLLKKMGEDSIQNSQECFKYFGLAMQFDFFNSLVQPLSLDNYLHRFSIIEDRLICQGLILGALDSIPTEDEPDLQDTDQQDQWEQQVEKNAQEFCAFFKQYFQQEQSSAEVIAIASKMAMIRRRNPQKVSIILNRFWLK